MPYSKDPKTQQHLFSDGMRFGNKAVVMHPYKNMFLTIKRTEHDHNRPGTWDLPGGYVEFGQNHREALRREVMEETALEIIDLKEVMVASHYDEVESMYYLFVGTRCRSLSEKVILSSEHIDYAWITREEFLSMDPSWKYDDERKLDITNTDFLRDFVYRAFER